jgi:uncharacterized DUF497 family protein
VKITSIIWLPEILEKLEVKHQLTCGEVEEVIKGNPIYRRGPRSKRRGENLYYAYGQTETGRYLFVVFIYKYQQKALILSARDMTAAERRLMQRF